MFGRSNNVTLASPVTTTGKRGRHFHYFGNRKGYGVATTTTNLSSTGKLCELRKSYSDNNHNHNHNHNRSSSSIINNCNNNFTTRRNPRHNVAIATQVISPSAIGQSSSSACSFASPRSSYHHRRRLVTALTGNEDEDDNDFDDGLMDRRRRCFSWTKFGCFGTAVLGSIIVMTIIVLAVGYMQSEKERVFSKPARYAQPGYKPSIISAMSDLDSSIEPSIYAANDNNNDNNLESHDSYQVTTYHPIKQVDSDNNINSDELQFLQNSAAEGEGHGNNGLDLDDNDHVTTHHPDSHKLFTLTTTSSNNDNAEVSNSNSEGRNFMNEISEFNENVPSVNHNNFNHNHDDNYELHHLHHQITSTSDQGQFDGSDFPQHSPPSEVKVLPPKDFIFNHNDNVERDPNFPIHDNGNNNNRSIVQQNDNKDGSMNGGLSFTIPIYSTTMKEEEGVAIASDILNSFTFSSSSTTTSPPTISSIDNANTTPDSYSSSSDDDSTNTIDGTTMATNSYSILTTATSTTESSIYSQIPQNNNNSSNVDKSNNNAQYSSPFNYSHEPQQNNIFHHQKNENELIAPPSTLDIPIVAKLQTDLFDDDVDVDGAEDATHNYKQSEVTVRNGIYNKDAPPGSSSGSGSRHGYLHNNIGYNNHNNNNKDSRPPRIKTHDRNYTPRPGSIVIVPDRPRFISNNKNSQQSTTRPKSFPIKTTSTTSSFSKLYEFHDASSNNNNNNHNDNNNNNERNHQAPNKNIEYISIESNPSADPIKNSNQNFNYEFNLPPSPSSTIAPSTGPENSYNINNNNVNNNANAFVIDYTSPSVEDRSKYNPLLNDEVNKFLLNLNKNNDANNIQFSTLGVGVNPVGNNVLGSQPNFGNFNNNNNHNNKNYGFATNAHLAAISNFDDFDFSQFLTKLPEPTASNNYGGATTPISDTDTQLTKRTFYTIPNLDSAASSSSSLFGSSNVDPYSYLQGSPSTSDLSHVIMGSPTSAGASLNLYQNYYDPRSNNNNNYNSYGNERIPSGTVPLDLASSYIPVSNAFQNYNNNQNQNHQHFKNNQYIPDASSSSSIGTINYNDPTSALANYYPGSGFTNSNNNKQNEQNSQVGNYNTITQGIHLLSLLSGNIPQHLLSRSDQASSSSNINPQYLKSPESSSSAAIKPELQIAALTGYGGSSPEFIQRMSKTLESQNPDRYLSTIEGRSLEPSDQLGSFSQNILTKFHTLKRKIGSSLKISPAKTATTSKSNKNTSDSAAAQPMDILGIRGLLNKYNLESNTSSSSSNGREEDKSDLFSILQPEDSILVKKDGVNMFDEMINQDLSLAASALSLIQRKARKNPSLLSSTLDSSTRSSVTSKGAMEPATIIINSTKTSSNIINNPSSSAKKLEKGLKSGFYAQ